MINIFLFTLHFYNVHILSGYAACLLGVNEFEFSKKKKKERKKKSSFQSKASESEMSFVNNHF